MGLRHGVDWDHIAAISDITATSQGKRHGFILGSFYALGHASIIIVLGLVAVSIGISLPSWVDTVMEPLVGLTLVLLGVWLIASIWRHGKSFRMKSRWMLIIGGINKFFHFLHSKITHKHKIPHVHYPDQYGLKTAFSIGMVHGIGAETPTQVFLFVTAAGVSKSFIGVVLLLLFVAGLLTSNTLITVVSAFGYAKMSETSKWRLVIGILTAIFSIIVGMLFLFHKTDVLPTLIGG